MTGCQGYVFFANQDAQDSSIASVILPQEKSDGSNVQCLSLENIYIGQNWNIYPFPNPQVAKKKCIRWSFKRFRVTNTILVRFQSKKTRTLKKTTPKSPKKTGLLNIQTSLKQKNTVDINCRSIFPGKVQVFHPVLRTVLILPSRACSQRTMRIIGSRKLYLGMDKLQFSLP